MNACDKVGVILLAGGKGTRLNSPIPKQFILLKQKPIVLYSLELLAKMQGMYQIVIVCDPAYRHLFSNTAFSNVTFALPGERRQDSVYNGLQALSSDCSYVCIHDSARPFVNQKMTESVLNAAKECGAAAVGVPIKFTLKETCPNQLVMRTPDRNNLWEIQTPQVIKRTLLEKGFAYAIENGCSVTDDVSLVELLGHPVKVVEGCYQNIKITTGEDLKISEFLVSCQDES